MSGRGAGYRLGLGEPIASVCAQCFRDMLHTGLGALDRLGNYRGTWDLARTPTFQ